MQVERSVDQIEMPDFSINERQHSYNYPHHNHHNRPSLDSRSHFCRNDRSYQRRLCVNSVQEPSKLPKPMERYIEEPKPKEKRKPKKKEKQPKPSKKCPQTEEVRPCNVEEPLKLEEPMECPLETRQEELEPAPPKETNHCCRKKRSDQYLSCRSSCCTSTQCSCVDEADESGMNGTSFCPCKRQKLCTKCQTPCSSTKKNNCDKEEDPCGEFFDVIQQSMEEVLKKSLVNVFGQYFTCCIDKINRLACQIERNEYLLRKIHKDLKDRMASYDRHNSQQLQYLCERLKNDKACCQKQKQCCMKFVKQCKLKCKPPQDYCQMKQSSSSSDDESRLRQRDECQSTGFSNLYNSQCEKAFGQVKSQFQKCGQQNTDKGKCKSQLSAENFNHHQSGQQSCDEVVINETDYSGPENRNIQFKTTKRKSGKEKLKRQKSETSDGSGNTSKK